MTVELFRTQRTTPLLMRLYIFSPEKESSFYANFSNRILRNSQVETDKRDCISARLREDCEVQMHRGVLV